MNWELTVICSPCFLMGCADSSGKKTVWEDYRRRKFNWVITLMKNP